MPFIQDRSRFLLTIAAITVSVLLFACVGEQKTAESPDKPAKPRVSEAMMAPAPPVQPAPQMAAPIPAPQAAPEPVIQSPTPVPPPEEEPEPPRPAVKQAPIMDGQRVFSNKDLKRYSKVKEEFGLDRDVVTVDLTPKTTETDDKPATTMTDEQRNEEMRETMKQINALNAEAAYLKSRIPSLHNPFLARVKPSESDATSEAGMDNAQRLAHVNERLSQVDSQLNQLQRRLADLHQVEPAQKTP